MENLTLQYHPAYILLCLLLGLVSAFVLYFNDKRFAEQKRWIVFTLAFMRFLLISLLSFFLLVPLIKSIFEEKKDPVIVIARDVSESTQDYSNQNDSKFELIFNELSKNFEIDQYSFSDNLYSENPDSLNKKSTNFEKLIKALDEKYVNQNVGAIIIESDGIFNEGMNPLYVSSNLLAPIYTIAIGDTSLRRDLMLKKVLNNNIVFLGDKFSIQADIICQNCAQGNSSLSISKVEDNGQLKVLETKTIRIDGSDFFTTEEFIIEAEESGIIQYRLGISPIEEEVSISNNYKDIFVEVLDARQKILLLADAPHPDLSALKQLLEKNKNYEVELSYIKDQDLLNDPYNIVILHNLPNRSSRIGTILRKPNISEAEKVFILGSQTDQQQFNQIQNVLSISGNSISLNETQAIIDPAFKLFTLSEELEKEISTYPPVITPFGEYTLLPGSVSMLNQKIGQVETEYPLLAFNNSDGKKTAVFVGEGLWKWRLFNYLQKDHYDQISELLTKSIQYINLKEDKRKFRVNTTEKIFRENEKVLFSAELYNDSYEKVNEPEVRLTLNDATGQEYNFVFSRAGQAYILDIGQFKSGNYNYTAETNYNGQLLQQKGKFKIENIQLESFNLTAQHGLLRQLSEESGGSIFYPQQANELIDAIQSNEKIKPVIYSSSKTEKMLNKKWILFLLIGLLSFEWFIRRYLGNY